MRGTYTSINHYCSHSTLLFTSYGTRSDFTENQLDRVRAPKRDCFTSPNRKKVMVFQCKHGYSFLHLWTETVRGLNQGPKLLTAKAQHDPTVRGIEWWNMQAILQQLHSAWSTKTVIIGLKKHEAKLFFGQSLQFSGHTHISIYKSWRMHKTHSYLFHRVEMEASLLFNFTTYSVIVGQVCKLV